MLVKDALQVPGIGNIYRQYKWTPARVWHVFHQAYNVMPLGLPPYM